MASIIGIAGMLAAPSWLVYQSRSELRQAVTEVANQLYEARVIARSQNTPVAVTIDLTNQVVRTTITNAATGALLRTGLSSQLPRVSLLRIGPSSGWTTATAATVSFTSVGTRAGGPGPMLNQELALVNDRGEQYALKVTPRGVTTWCPTSTCP